LANEQATLRDLLCHRTGLDRHDELWEHTTWDRDELLRRIGHVKPARPFRTAWQYQNVMYLAAGQSVGAVSSSSWERVVQKRLFDVLGMRGANFRIQDAKNATDHASPHHTGPEKTVTPIPWKESSSIGPAGAINASARDMAQWVRFQLGDGTFEGKRVLSTGQLREPHAPQIMLAGSGGTAAVLESFFPDHRTFAYGLGWFVIDYRNHRVVWHGGNINGFTAQVCLAPTERIGLVILSNRQSTPMTYALQHSLLDHLLGMPKRDWNTWVSAAREKLVAARRAAEEADRNRDESIRQKNSKPSHPLESYAGIYEDPAYGRVRVVLDGGSLQFEWSDLKSPLSHFHFDTFVTSKEAGDSDLGRRRVTFSLGADGPVAALQVFGREFKKTATTAPDDRQGFGR
jgi:CubicO group peptidase (beta-lactamase class C family)